LSAVAALLHIAIIFGGPDWYRRFGAGEEMARAAERGSARPAVMTIGIAVILLAWAAYGFSGAGAIRRLPLLRTVLVLISAIYLARALAAVPILLLWPERVDSFLLWSSVIVLAYGLSYAVGTWAVWPSLNSLKS
jgi:hypothetical protein